MLKSTLKALRPLLPLVPAILLYGHLVNTLNFYQDDAYISFRYVANYLNGDGLVFNIGERVEGYTNFGWIIYLIGWGLIGLNYIVAAKVTGIVFGAALIILTYLTAQLVFGEKRKLLAIGASYLVAANWSLAYWAPAGLETAAFALCAALALFWYLKGSWLLILPLMYAALLRPDGAVIAGLLITIEFLRKKQLPRFTLTASALAAICVLPHVWFKLTYYGTLLPNSFYAKTGFDVNQLSSGLQYAGEFMAHYGFYGAALLVPLFWWRKLTFAGAVIWVFTSGFTLYIILIGGDVLKVHRFFLPLFGTSAILLVLSLEMALKRFPERIKTAVSVVALAALVAATFILPQSVVKNFNFRERNLTKKMSDKAQLMKMSDPTNFSVALTTIGRFSYELIGHDIIDMLGLTDSTIARHPSGTVKGMHSSWREQKHNAAYVLKRKPDYIIFSTGLKPSAPAEKELLLYPRFLQSYRTVGWVIPVPSAPGGGIMVSVYKKMRAHEGEIAPVYPLEYVENYKIGLEIQSRGRHAEAIRYFERALEISPRPYYLNLLYQKAFSHLRYNERKIARELLHSIIEQDSLVFEAHRDLYSITMLGGDTVRAKIHKKWLLKLVPWYFPRLDSLTKIKQTQLEDFNK